MAFKILIKPIVFIDADEAVSYYEKQLLGLGQKFYANFLLSLNDIQQQPFFYTFVKPPVRRCRIDKFPYKVFYIVADDTISIIGLAHAKRSNAYIKRRLRML
ncbi:MAG: type II toxin-antitoxin system RelE/ParE family toxin [Pedobacter sp.]|nr:type II toxin-antitoxin system RelE/ParE family toxin [Chitinophagaceae bacterium]